MFDRNNENYVYEIVSKNIKKQRKLKGLTQEIPSLLQYRWNLVLLVLKDSTVHFQLESTLNP